MRNVIGIFMLASAIAAGAVLAASAGEGRRAPNVGAASEIIRKSAAGKIAVRAGRGRFPANAEVSLARTRRDDARRRIKDGLKKRWNVLAMYDVSIRDGGGKWQPDAGAPVRVTIDLEEPVTVPSGGNPGVVHLADDGTVEELPSSRFGFAYNADGTAVTAFWFDAAGFSVYAIVDGSGGLKTARRFYHFYGHPSPVAGSNAVRTFPYRYADQSNDVVNVQIVKDGDMLKEPPVPEDILDENGVLVSAFEGWYVVHSEPRPPSAAERKLDSADEPFEFVWPVGVTERHLAFTNCVEVTEAVDMDYRVVPLYEHARYLQFNENELGGQGAAERIIDRKIVVLNDETGVARIKVSDVSAALKNDRQEYFCGWRHLDKNGRYADLLMYSHDGMPQEAYIDVDDGLFHAGGGNSIQLWPLYVPAHFLNFDTNAKGSGATYVGSLFLRSTTDISSVAPSGNRPGYDFAGWCVGTVEGGKVALGERVTDADGRAIPNVVATNSTGETVLHTDADGNIRLDKDVTLYASWIATSSASYRVIVWQQRVTDPKDASDADKKYFYVTHYTSPEVSAATAISESMVAGFTGTRADGVSIAAGNLETLSGMAADNVAGEDFTGFHYARWGCDDATVASDGSTVVNVYYDRDLITLRFCLYDGSRTETVYSMSAATSGALYGTEDGENYFDVYYDNGQWYKTRTESSVHSGNYYYSDEYSGTRYTRSGYSWTGYSYNATTGTSGTQYGKEGNDYFQIYRNSSDGLWYRTRGSSAVYSYSDPYSGSRYEASTSNWIVNQAMTGLYGQTLEANGYAWPKERAWKDAYGGSTSSGTSISFLDAFLPTSGGDETFYSSATSSSTGAIIYFYKEALDGSWTLANEYHSGSSSVSFNISDKYNGFEAYQYSKNGGAWTDVGAYNAKTGYYGSQVASVTDRLEIRFKRKEFELIYKDGDGTVYDTGKNVPYESSLAEYNLGLNDSRLDWGGRDTSTGTFEGWYEDASLTVPFDFSGTMPDGKKFLYAKWAPVKYKVVVDPNGGELQSGDSTWFYLDAGEKLVEYAVTRKYRLDMHNGTYYYHHDPWDPVKDKHTGEYDPSTAGAPRRAYYTENVEDATANAVSDPENRYTYEPGVYSFMGWYEVLEDGTVSTDPFNFSEPPNRPVSIRAIWRRTSVYAMKYESVDPDGMRPTEVICDPESGEGGGYIDNGITMVGKDPGNYDREKWIWEGWHVVDVRNNYNPLTNIRSPGDIYVVHAEHADDRDNTIHFRAVYSLVESGASRHIPEVVDFVLDSNDGGMLAAGESIETQEGRLGTYTDGADGAAGGLNAGVWFAGRQDNFSVNLADYSPAFAHESGSFLLGWDTNRVNDTVIPAYYANETVGIDNSDPDGNVLYAVWEPQVYIEFANDTGDTLRDITFYIPSWTAEGLFRVNKAAGIYLREPFADFADGAATFDLAPGERLRLVLPDAAGRDFAVFGDSAYPEGTKLAIELSEPHGGGEAAAPDGIFNAYAGEHYQIAGTMMTSPEPVRVRFAKSEYPASTMVPVRYFLHDKDGTVTEITQYDPAWWKSQGYRTSIEAGAAASDIAGMLRGDSGDTGVHGLLSDNVRTNYGHTTIGIGVASAAVTADHETLHANEYRSITQEGSSGGPYFRFFHEKLEWSRYSQIWNGYGNPAVYVVFYKRTPVHVTVGKSVVGSDEDKSRAFQFAAQITQHSTNVEYTVTTTYRKTRTLTCQTSSSREPNAGDWNDPDWSDPVAIATNTSPATASSDQTPDLFEPRHAERFSLADSGRHPITIYYDSSEENVGEPVQSDGLITNGKDSYTTSGSIFNRKYNHSKTQTNTWTQTVAYRVTYQYEIATIEESETDAFVLAGVGGDGDSCKGSVDLAARTYTVSSLGAPDANGFFSSQSLDTAIFKNERKTGSLTVSKTVVDGDADDMFNFIVTLGETVVDKDGYAVPPGVHLGPFGKVFTFSLANGGSRTLTGLPAGAAYTVEEVANDKYTATVPANAAGAIAADATIAVGFTNTRKRDLSIAMKDRTVYFNGEEQHGCEIAVVTGAVEAVETGDYAVTGLKAGHVLSVEHHVPAHGTAVGGYAGHFENARVTVRDSGGNDVTDEYIIAATPGSLTIEPTPLVVTVTGNRAVKTYNGEEQSCEGYAFTVVHAATREPVQSENIYVSIPPEYQQAFRKDVGRSEMHIQPNHVNVTAPEGMSVEEIVVAENGYIEIAPAAATVKADDKTKIFMMADPPATATVTGLFGGDTLEYAMSRAPGEEPGSYAITAAGDAVQGNYTVSYEPGTLSIEKLELVQRSTGSKVPVSIPVSEGLVDALGFDSGAGLSASAVGGALNALDGNGLRRWENLVTGTAFDRLLLGTAADATSTNLTLRLNDDPARREDLGYTVLYELRKREGGVWRRLSAAAGAEAPAFTVDAEDATGYYRIVALVVPESNPAITNEIPATNVVGVLRIASTAEHTMTAVPFLELPKDPALKKPVKVDGYIRGGFVEDGDVIRVRENGTFKVWEMENGRFEPFAAVTSGGETRETPDASDSVLVPGRTVWVSRKKHDEPFMIFGQFSGEAVEVEIAGAGRDESGKIVAAATMVANPNLEPLKINDIDWGGNPADGLDGDSIEIPSTVDGAMSTRLSWSPSHGCWGQSVPKKVGKRFVQTFVSDFEIPAGLGFWYYRTGEEPFKITVKKVQVLE